MEAKSHKPFGHHVHSHIRVQRVKEVHSVFFFNYFKHVETYAQKRERGGFLILHLFIRPSPMDSLKLGNASLRDNGFGKYVIAVHFYQIWMNEISIYFQCLDNVGNKWL